jgi:hypothetical protein
VTVAVPEQLSNTPNKPSVKETREEKRLVMESLPLTPLETFLLHCNSNQSPMVIRVMMRLTGDCQLEVLTRTLQQAIERHPLLSCQIQQKGRQSHWVTASPGPIEVRRGSGSVYQAERGALDKSIDLTQTAGLHVTIIILDDGIKVHLDAHHAVTDGNGLRQLVTEWLHLYHCEVTDAPLRLPIVDPDRLLQRDRFPQPKAIEPLSLKDALRNLLVTIRGRTSRWSPMQQNDKHSKNESRVYCVEEIFSEEQSLQLRERLAAWNVKLNDLVMVCCMSIFAQQAPTGSMSHRVTVLNPTDLRLPSDRSMPATNRFGVAFMRRMRSECLDPAQLLRGIQEEMNYVRTNYIGAEFLKGLAAASKIPFGIDLLRGLGFFIPSLQYTCLGDVTRGGRRLIPYKNGVVHSGGLRLETVTGFAPFAENVPLSIASCETGKRMTLTVRSSARFMSLGQTQTFAAALVELLCTLELPTGSGVESDSSPVKSLGLGVTDDVASG